MLLPFHILFMQFNFLQCKSPARSSGSSLLRFQDPTLLDTLTRQESSEQVIILSYRPLPTQHTANTRHKHPFHAFRGIRTRHPSNQTSADLRLRPHSHRDRNRNKGRALTLTHCLRIVNYFIIQPTYIRTLKNSISCARCRLKPVAISWLRPKLQRVTSLQQSCCPSPPVKKLHFVFGWACLIFWWACFIIWWTCFIFWWACFIFRSGHSLY